MKYIQRRDGKQLETVDEFETLKEARLMLAEYRISDGSAHFYISSRACKEWGRAHICGLLLLCAFCALWVIFGGIS